MRSTRSSCSAEAANSIPSEESSLHVFRRFIKVKGFTSEMDISSPNTATDENQNMILLPGCELDASGVLSKECYLSWLNTRRSTPLKPEEAFRRVLTSHVRGTGGRKPFHQEEEAAILTELRKKRVWPCFDANYDCKSRVGIQGFAKMGYHEIKAGVPSDDKFSEDAPSRSDNISSYDIFMQFVNPSEDNSFELKTRILSHECFEIWMRTRKNEMANPSQVFRKTVFAHIYGRDGRRKFAPDLEIRVLSDIETLKRINVEWPLIAIDDAVNNQNQLSGSKRRRTYSFSNDEEDVQVQHQDVNGANHIENVNENPKTEYDTHLNNDVAFFNLREAGLDLEGFDFDYLFDDPALQQNNKILSEFSDVSPEEVQKVEELKGWCRSEIAAYVENCTKPSNDNCLDVIGDVRLLRTLRQFGGHVQLARTELLAYLTWRKDSGTDAIRKYLLEDNPTIDDLRRRYFLRELGIFPTIGATADGSFVDVIFLHTMKTNAKDLSLSLNNLDVSFVHRLLWEYRSILLDRLSYAKKRVVMFKLIIDCGGMLYPSSPGPFTAMCWEKLGSLGDFLSELSKIGNSQYSGVLSKMYLLGNGDLFNFLLKVCESDPAVREFCVGVGGFQGIFFVDTERKKSSMLLEEFGTVDQWPAFFGGQNVSYVPFSFKGRRISHF